MPVHDWTRVNGGTFHDFHCAWITHLKEAFNAGLLPPGYYAQSEQHTGRLIADVLTLQENEAEPTSVPGPGGVAVAEAPPKAGRKVVASPNAAYRAARRTLTVRHASGHRIVALLEILSPSNKDRPANVEDFVDTALASLAHGCHLLVVDLHPPGAHDPRGIHGAVWEWFDPEDYVLECDKRLTLAAYVASPLPEAYVAHVAVDDELPDMPLFLQANRHIDVPLEATYRAAYRGIPAVWREVLEAATPRA